MDLRKNLDGKIYDADKTRGDTEVSHILIPYYTYRNELGPDVPTPLPILDGVVGLENVFEGHDGEICRELGREFVRWMGSNSPGRFYDGVVEELRERGHF